MPSHKTENGSSVTGFDKTEFVSEVAGRKAFEIFETMHGAA